MWCHGLRGVAGCGVHNGRWAVRFPRSRCESRKAADASGACAAAPAKKCHGPRGTVDRPAITLAAALRVASLSSRRRPLSRLKTTSAQRPAGASVAPCLPLQRGATDRAFASADWCAAIRPGCGAATNRPHGGECTARPPGGVRRGAPNRALRRQAGPGKVVASTGSMVTGGCTRGAAGCGGVLSGGAAGAAGVSL